MADDQLVCAHCGAQFDHPGFAEGDDCPLCGLGHIRARRRFVREGSSLGDDDATANASWAEMPAEYFHG